MAKQGTVPKGGAVQLRTDLRIDGLNYRAPRLLPDAVVEQLEAGGLASLEEIDAVEVLDADQAEAAKAELAALDAAAAAAAEAAAAEEGEVV